jgi:hypothetical protein
MNILIKKPEVGEKVHTPISGVTGTVIRLLNFQDAFGWDTDEQLAQNAGKLLGDLGENYVERYFEVVIKVEALDEESTYAIGDECVIDWEEYQNSNTL